MPSFVAYKMNIYKGNSSIYFPDYASVHWNDYKDNLIGSVNWVIPYNENENFVSEYNSLVGSGWGNEILNYVTGIITEKGQTMNGLVPWGWCGAFTANVANPSKITAYGRIMQDFPNIKNLYEILSDYNIAPKEIFVLSPENSDCYIATFYGDSSTPGLVGGLSDSILSIKNNDQQIDSGQEDILSTLDFSVDDMRSDGKILVKYNGGYAKIYIDTRPPYEGYIISAYPEIYSSPIFSVAADALFDGAIPLSPDNPYEPVPQPEPEPAPVPTGEFDFHTDPIPIPSLPTISAADTGFTRLFNPSLSQLNQLADYMWTDATFWDTLKNKFIQMIEDPMKYIISLNLVPVAVPNGSPIPVKLLFISTGINMPPVTNQFVNVDCGTYIVKRNYGSALDFSPNTKVSLYLPYIGMVPLDVDEIMPSPPNDTTVVGVNYVVDVFSGTCVAMVTVNGDVRYQFSGHCAIGIPFSSADFSVYQGALIQAAKTALGAAATAAGMPGVGAALLGAPVQKTSETVETVTRFNPDTNRKLSPWEDKKSSVTKAQFGSLMANNITNTVSQVAASKPNIERSAGFSGNTGYLAVRRPFLLFESPRLVNPNEYGKYNGYPCMMYLPFANLSGFTQVQQIQLVGFSGTNPEIDELLALLKSGVIF